MDDAREVAVFDLDGVLTRRDTFTLFVVSRFRRRPLRVALVLPLVPLMLLPATRRWAITAAVRISLIRLTVAQYQAEAAAFARELAATPGALQPGCVEQARAHLDAGARVVFATASETALARALLDAAGLPDAELVASRLVRAGRGWQVALHNLGAEKPRQLAAHGVRAPWAVAYSDHAVDLPLLRGAEVAVLVNASPAFLGLARAELEGEVHLADWPAG
ncbi:haloacid dehalogenase-like hydrolase [Conexibacter sp. JD483]|uniref:haloacid dehalogenase-like hydrolase n=1 Tax=unclassified Conexibacter TaxID=2627773 RepID=UPI002724D39D|nr:MULTISPECIES: haloacid dehalogenase-like hydrolase [unclassified Conexibacter]MDO8184589.1 haloacid dehalogenase-like hydrolase [Conexibacter sp. CPCC 205706]MDO8197895.1 haloacid dehalogenase-like hydrolase [Conexibacter sp. CPCC 205762]MDR9370140.1 haloacid dehalogenase-like hydrolase [Conexibacter sp. JD483]